MKALSILILTFWLCQSATAQYIDWFVERTDEVPSSSGTPSLALSSNGEAKISHYDSSLQALRYSQWTGAAWSSEVVDSGQVGTYSSLVLDSNGWPRISYYDAFYKDLKYAEWNGVSWSRAYVDGASSAAGMYSSLALDTNGEPCISYYDETRKDLRYAWRTEGNWTNRLVDGTNDCGSSSSLAVDSNGIPRIAYVDMTNSYWRLRYARWNGSAWDIDNVDTNGNPGLYASLRLTRAGLPVIAYRAVTPMDLRYAWFDGSTWTQTVVDSWGDAGYWTSLALDSNDLPHISYAYKPGAGDWDLRYTHFNGTFWETRPVYVPFDTGHETSIALRPDGLARIAFLDYQSQSIWLAGQDTFYTLSPSYGSFGQILPWGDVGIRSGSSTSFTVQAHSYYHIDTVLQDGLPVGSFGPGSNQYLHLFSQVVSNHTLYASFMENRAARGTPEWWLAAFGWTNQFNQAETNDVDRDGQAGWEEFLGGTDPLDSNSWFRVQIQPGEGDQIQITWPSTSGRVYALDTGTVDAIYGLSSNFIESTPAVNVITDSMEGASLKLYRIRAWRP